MKAMFVTLFLFVISALIYTSISSGLYDDTNGMLNLLSEAHGVVVEAALITFVANYFSRRHERKLDLKRELEKLEVFRAKQNARNTTAIELGVRAILRMGYKGTLNLSETKLDSIDLSALESRFRVSISFSDSRLHQAQFDGSTLSGCNFENSDLYKASFRNCSLVECGFGGADLRDVDWTGVEIDSCYDLHQHDTENREVVLG